MFGALTQVGRAQIWTQAQALVSAEPGAELRLYGGNVSGKTLDAVPGKRLHLEWRLQSWPTGTPPPAPRKTGHASGLTRILSPIPAQDGTRTS